MKSTALQFVCVFSLLNSVCAGRADIFSTATNEDSEVKKHLEAYENGRMDLSQLDGTNAQESCQRLIRYYIEHTNDISEKAQLPISRCFAGLGNFAEGARLAGQYLNVYSNDFKGWEILGYCHVALGKHDKAIDDYAIAVNLGDTNSYEPLAGEAIRGHRIDIVQKILPQLLRIQHAKETSQEHKVNLTTILLGYSLITDRSDFFVKTLAGQDMNELLKDSTIRKNVASGCEIFKGKEIDKIRQELEAASGNNSSSSDTNSP